MEIIPPGGRVSKGFCTEALRLRNKQHARACRRMVTVISTKKKMDKTAALCNN